MEIVNMATKKPNTKIENGKVVFSKEILDYFESIRTEENSEWINKYFEILSDLSNFDAKKFNIHHIRPVFSFKDENHKNRKEAKGLADEFNENRIKLSIYNHILAHYCLWKIFNNWDSKHAVHQLCDINDCEILTETEIKEIARIKEDCTKENVTEEETKEYQKNYRKVNKERLNEYSKNYCEINNEELKRKWKEYYYKHRDKYLEEKRNYNYTNSKEISERNKLRRKNNPEKFRKQQRDFYEKHRDKILNKEKIKRSVLCYDYMQHNFCTLSALYSRKYKNKELYNDVNPSEYILRFTPYTQQIPLILIKPLFVIKNNENDIEEQKRINKIKRAKRAKEYRKNNKEIVLEREKKFRSKLCFDPIKNNFCKLTALKGRKRSHDDLYKNINPIEWVLKFTPIISQTPLILIKSLNMIVNEITQI